MAQTKSDMKRERDATKERDSLREYAESFFTRFGRDVFQGLGIAIGAAHWLALTAIYLDLARPWGKKGRERLGTPSGDGWVSVDDMVSLFGIQRARVTLQTALRICKAIREYLTAQFGDYKGQFPKHAAELYETAAANFASSTVTINALYKACKADPRYRDALAIKAPDWSARATGLVNTLLRRFAQLGLDGPTLAERHASGRLTVADAPFLFLTSGHIETLQGALVDAYARMPKVAPEEARVAVANTLLDLAIVTNEGVVAEMETAIRAAEEEETKQAGLVTQDAT